MTFLDLVRRRRSVRRFTPDPVPRPLLERCVEAARYAPSACHSEPWRFHVVDDPALRGRFAAAAFSGVYRMNAFARSAPCLVALEALPSAPAARAGGLWQGVAFNAVDAAIAGEHFCLQAAELGLGTCWLGWFDRRAVPRFLGLPRAARVDFMFAVGWPAGEPAPKRRKALGEILAYHEAPRPGKGGPPPA